METVAERFVALRKALGLTQEDVMRNSGGQRTAISKVESGENQLTGAALLRVVAEAFGCAMEQLQDYITGVVSLKETLPLCEPPAKTAGRPPSVPPPAPWYPVDEKTREEATEFLLQPPHPLTLRAIDLAFPRIRIEDPEAAKDPSFVAQTVRLYVSGVGVTSPGESAGSPSGARRSSKR